MNMMVPVLIPARNEEDHIVSTLRALKKQTLNLELVVIINGCTDRTAELARSNGATVLKSAEGKMLAIQCGLRHLAQRASGPVLILDADSRPFSKRWAEHMTSELASMGRKKPAIVWGQYMYDSEINPVLGLMLSFIMFRSAWRDRKSSSPARIRGGNMGLRMNDALVIEQMLELDNFWPREDVAMFDLVHKHGGSHRILFSSVSTVWTSGFRTKDTFKRLLRDWRHPSKVMDTSYTSDAPKNSKPYFSQSTERFPHEH
jgi:glycosyltransferase involved in cell wall biosynthesis